MPEGHTVHRIADEFNRLFAGKPVTVDSPQGRFTDARLVSGRNLDEATAVGKQMFLHFDGGAIVRIHLGIYGKWRFHRDGAPEVIGQVRARFMSGANVAELRGPTICEVIADEQYREVLERLGPDPLNPDPKGQERERFVLRASNSKTPIGLLLMNQEVISGVGNVYRAELLFRAKVDPHRPGNSVSTRKLREIWNDSVALLQVGVRHGVMITRDEFLDADPGKSDRNFVYKREGQKCRNCSRKVVLEVIGGRKLYRCPGCQR